ncbi:hypothetical protein BDAP_000142 [Binucleata daphniae]
MKNSVNKNLIFRVCSNKTHFLEIPLKINNDFVYNFDEKTVHENAGVYKGYIREVLNGLFPVCISKTLVYLTEKYSLDDFSYKKINSLVKYLPFAMSEEEREILVNIFEMWDLIDINEIETCMNYESLAIVFSPSMFEKNFIKKIENAKVPTKLAKLLFFLDYNKIDLEVYEDFRKEVNTK